MSKYKDKLENLPKQKDDTSLHILDDDDLLQVKSFLTDFASLINKTILDKESSTYEEQSRQYQNLTKSIDTITEAIDKGISVNNLNEIEQLKEIVVTNLKDIQITTEKVDIPEWLASEKGLQQVVESVDIATRQIKALGEVKPSQKVDDYIPYRRVRYDGFKLVYDDTYWGATAGGGGGSSGESDGLTDEQLRATPVPVAISGGATETKQDSQIALATQLETLVETLNELVQRLAPLAGAMRNTAQLGVIGSVAVTSAPSTAVTGPITSAQSIAEKAVAGIMYPEKVAIINSAAVQSNINNAVAA